MSCAAVGVVEDDVIVVIGQYPSLPIYAGEVQSKSLGMAVKFILKMGLVILKRRDNRMS